MSGLLHRHIVVMGVCACGKSTVGEALAAHAKLPFADGDAFHPDVNIAKMEAGTPLTDADRWPWLTKIGEELGRSDGLVIACSALKRSYRDLICEKAERPVAFAHLIGTKELLSSRMGQRTGHFMPTSLLDSQLETLEVPGSDELSVSIDIDTNVGQIVDSAMQFLTTKETA